MGFPVARDPTCDSPLVPHPMSFALCRKLAGGALRLSDGLRPELRARLSRLKRVSRVWHLGVEIEGTFGTPAAQLILRCYAWASCRAKLRQIASNLAEHPGSHLCAMYCGWRVPVVFFCSIAAKEGENCSALTGSLPLLHAFWRCKGKDGPSGCRAPHFLAASGMPRHKAIL